MILILVYFLPDGYNDEEPATAGGGYNSVPFSYGKTGESSEQKDADAESSFRPPFPVPESLLQCLVSTCSSSYNISLLLFV